MNVLCQGPVFYVGQTPLHLYRGRHVLRTLCAHAEFQQSTFDYYYDLEKDTIHDVLERIGAEWKPDRLLFWSPEDQVPPRGIEDSPIPSAAVCSDWNHVYPRIGVNLGRFDVVFCDRPGIDALANEWVEPRYFGPVYSQNSRFHRPHDVDKDIDVVYVGGFNHVIRPERGRYLARLARLSDRYRIVLAEGYFGDEYARLLSRARIVFNHSVRSELNLRVFETFACGGVPFLEESNREAAEWLEDGRDIVLYNEENFEERIQYYLGHVEESEQIVARCRERATEFAGENRLDGLIDWIASQPSSARRFRSLPPLEQAYQEVLLHSGSWLRAVRQREKTLMEAFASRAPEDARAWTLIGAHLANPFLNPYLTASNDAAAKAPCRQALLRAHELDPESAPYAINAAWACAWAEDTEGETRCLESALAAHGMAGAELVLGNVSDPFWAPWMYAVAEKRAHPGMVHAEAHARLAMLTIQQRRFAQAEDHLDKALEIEPEFAGAGRLLGKLCWAQGRREDALSRIQRYCEEMPFDYTARQRFETMLRHAGRIEAANAVADETRRLRVAAPAQGEEAIRADEP